MKDKFVLSSKEFDNVKDAEHKVYDWYKAGTLKQKTKLYKIVEIYDLKLKFIKRKSK